MGVSFFDLMNTEIANLDGELLEPQGEAREGETILGTVPEEAKKVFHLSRVWERAAAEAAVSARYTNDSDLRADCEAKIVERREKAKVLSDIFWILIRDQLALWGGSDIGVREGWVVVSLEKREGSFLDFLGGMLG